MEITSGQPAISVGGGNGGFGFGGDAGIMFRMPQGYTFNAGPGPFGAQPLPPFPAVSF